MTQMTENLHIPLSYYFTSLVLVNLNLIVVILLASSLASLVVLSPYTSVFSSNLTYGHMSVVYSIKYNLPTSPHLFIQHFRMMVRKRTTIQHRFVTRHQLIKSPSPSDSHFVIVMLCHTHIILNKHRHDNTVCI